jgi:hypothetical protein
MCPMRPSARIPTAKVTSITKGIAQLHAELRCIHTMLCSFPPSDENYGNVEAIAFH